MDKNIYNNYTLRKNIWRTLRLYWEIDRIDLIGYLCLIILQVTSSLLIVFIGSRIIGQLTLFFQHKPVSHDHVYLLVAGLSLAILGDRFSWQWISFIQRKAWIKWYVRMTVDFNGATSSFDMEQLNDFDIQKKIQKVSQEYQYTPQNFANYILQCLHSIVRLISSLVIVFTFAPWLILIMAASLIPGFYAEKKFSQLKWNLWGEKGDKPLIAQKTTKFLEDKHSLQETKVFGTRDYLLNYLKGMHVDFYNRQLKYLKNTRTKAFLGIVSEVAVAGGVTLWLITKVLNNSLSLANYSFYSGIILQFGSSLSLIAISLNFIYDNNTYMKDLFLLIDIKPRKVNSDKAVAIDKNTKPTIKFVNVSFTYPGSEKPVIKDVSFTINPGDSVALVGENGSGKTTLIKLLLRFYDVSNGKILVNDINIQDLDLESYYHHIGVLFQDFNDYPFSVRDNIALGKVEEFDNTDRVHQAARTANAHSFIKKYPEGYQQILEPGFENGIEPSGGQWQRIALARALFRNADILILDEPTAAVDAKAEYEIFKTLENYSSVKTTVIISHRFSTVRKAKKIVVIEKGEIIEQGTHNELIGLKHGLYKEMFEKQASGYK